MPRPPSFRFSLRSLMLLTSLCAVTLTCWLAFIYEPPTHEIPLYEKAPFTRRLSKQVGPNLVAIKLVARNRRDGRIAAEDGHGKPQVNQPAVAAALLSQAASWLDIVQIELTPKEKLLDILELRIFDHETRTLLSDVNQNFGYRVLPSNLIQLYGLGADLPEKVDVWLRLQSYDPSDKALRLNPTRGATCQLPGGTLKLTDLRAGSWAYDSRKNPRHHLLHGNDSDIISTELEWQGNWQAGRYQIAAVTKDGQKRHASHPHFIRFYSNGLSRLPIQFPIALTEIDHFEMRPFGGRHRFFFEAVKLPVADGGRFQPPPTAMVAINRQEVKLDLDEFAPLSLNVATLSGVRVAGNSSSGGRYSVRYKKHDQLSDDEYFALVYRVEGLGQAGWDFEFLSADTNRVLSKTEMRQRSSGEITGGTNKLGTLDFESPLDEVGAVKIRLQSPP